MRWALRPRRLAAGGGERPCAVTIAELERLLATDPSSCSTSGKPTSATTATSRGQRTCMSDRAAAENASSTTAGGICLARAARAPRWPQAAPVGGVDARPVLKGRHRDMARERHETCAFRAAAVLGLYATQDTSGTPSRPATARRAGRALLERGGRASRPLRPRVADEVREPRAERVLTSGKSPSPGARPPSLEAPSEPA
jgi:hypothetical protein